MTAEFDRYQSTYSDAVNRSIAFAGTDVDFFAELKADDLLALAGRQLGDPSKLAALDFGCGTGIMDALIAPRLGRVAGVDVSEGLTTTAAEANPGVEYRTYDGARLPYEDNAFDLAFAVCVLHHVDPMDRRPAAHELARVVRPGGMVAIYEHNPLNPLTRLAVSRCEFDEGVELLPLRETSRLLADAGMRPVEARFVAFFPWRGSWLRALEGRLSRVPLGGQYVVAATKVEAT
jgi:SAM-dependent methyltransferase